MPSATCSLVRGVPNNRVFSKRIRRSRMGSTLAKAALDSIITDPFSHTAPLVEQQALVLQNKVAYLIHASSALPESLESLKNVFPDAKELESTVRRVVEPYGLDFEGWQPHWGRKLLSSALFQLVNSLTMEFTKIIKSLS